MSNTAYIGSGTTLSSKYYLRSFYRSNREAGTSSKRREFSGNQLALADGRALRQAVRRLTSSDFSDDQDANTRNSVLAYIQTYNNMLSSAGSSSDRTLERSAKQLKNITSEYSSELDKIGITVNDDGTLTSRTTLFESADLSKFKELFSADAAYMQRTSTYAKRFASRGEALVTSDNNLLMQKNCLRKNAAATGSSATDGTTTSGATESPDDGTATTAAQIVSQSLDLDTLLNTGIGKNINIIL